MPKQIKQTEVIEEPVIEQPIVVPEPVQEVVPHNYKSVHRIRREEATK
jgi:hypothetical protein